MRQFIHRGVLANLIAMLRADVRGAIWLADADDEARFYEQCAHPHARVLATHGDALGLLADTRSRGIAGVVAAIRGAPPADDDECVFRPEVGDTASLALRSSAFKKVLSEIAGPEWWRATESEIGSLAERAIGIAWSWERVLEAAGHSGEWPEDTIKEAIDWTSLTVRGEFAAERLGDQAETLKEPITSLEMERDTERKLREIDGRNALRVIAEAAVLYTPLGLRARQQVDVATIMAMFNVAFDIETLEADSVFWQMRRWERHNRRFPLLKLWRVMDSFGLVLDQRYWRSDLELLLGLQRGEPLTAFKMDLDNFKGVNEALGHVGGDEAIREYLHAAQASLGGAAEVYRRGGDEVVAFAPGVGLADAMVLAERLRHEIERRFREWGQSRGLEVPPTASIGVVEVVPNMSVTQVEELMESAQWQAKKDGKNRVVSIPASSPVEG